MFDGNLFWYEEKNEMKFTIDSMNPAFADELTSFNFLLSNFFAIAGDSFKSFQSIRLLHTEIDLRLTAFGAQ